MLRINILRVEGKPANQFDYQMYRVSTIGKVWFRLQDAWTAWIRQNFTVEERVNTKLQAVAHELTKMQR